MRSRVRAAIAISIAVAAIVSVDFVSRGPSKPPAPNAAAPASDRGMVAPAPSKPQFRGALEDCTTRSEANFPGGFTSPDNLVVGPLALVGGAYTDARTVRDFGGNKFPVLVKVGHWVTVRLARAARRTAGLAYGPRPQGQTRLRDTYRSVTFVACRPGRASRRYSRNGPSGSYADSVQVTFWSGFVLTRAPACIPLEVYVDGAAAPQRVGLALGRRCGQ